jgi:hypothetical protein
MNHNDQPRNDRLLNADEIERRDRMNWLMNDRRYRDEMRWSINDTPMFIGVMITVTLAAVGASELMVLAGVRS